MVLKVKICQTKNKWMNSTNQLLENLKYVKYTLLLKIVFGGADQALTQVITKSNKEIQFLLCAMEFYSKYALAFPFKHKNVLQLPKHLKIF